ncbi:amino acid adenylation domain-containing protein [Colwellia demingiae]|uniref:Amino acid adenylation domain-containing protein n=1 Tax=Colwellia demingiae TaxID=89401 RepID=A0A5C6Q7K6_9GAMM|nr:AMP-binding protein [Colwellia demingiae]TWX64577.1 amino acid adenylation domain-containing protein [Colwellia demingiae]
MNLYQASFLNAVRQFPDNTALYTEESSGKANRSSAKTFTYQKLFEVSQRWGNYIAHFNKEQRPVAIYGGRQWHMYAGILAILSTNNAYVPLNNKQPANRISKVLSQIDGQVLLVAENEDPTELLQLTEPSLVVIYLGADNAKWLSNNWHHQCFSIGDIDLAVTTTSSSTSTPIPSSTLTSNTRSLSDQLNDAELKLKTANHFAYILFTSGSTGVPKGIAVSHKNIVSHLGRLDELLRLKATDKVSQFFELSFDLSVHDMFSCWSKGAALYVIPSERLMCPLAFIKQHELTVFSGVASILSFMDRLSLLKPQQLPHLRVSCFGGEKLLTNQALKWQQCAHNSRVINIYGPTECTITATYYELSDNQTIKSASVPIGKALPGLSTILVTDKQKITSTNTLAELYLAGDQLVEGYFQDAEKTQQAFITLITDVGKTPVRYYRTGDIVYYDEQQNIVFHGRNDHQFKTSGHRVEAAEIEDAIVNFSNDITWCVVSAQTEIAGNTRIMAFIETAQVSNPALHSDDINQQKISELRKHCLQHLPAYMVPDEFNLYRHLPRNISGKVDINALLNNAVPATSINKTSNKFTPKEATPC